MQSPERTKVKGTLLLKVLSYATMQYIPCIFVVTLFSITSFCLVRNRTLKRSEQVRFLIQKLRVHALIVFIKYACTYILSRAVIILP